MTQEKHLGLKPRTHLNRSAKNIPSKRRIASIAPDDALILARRVNPTGWNFRKGHHASRPYGVGKVPLPDLLRFVLLRRRLEFAIADHGFGRLTLYAEIWKQRAKDPLCFRI